MKRLLSLVALMASMSFGTVVEINLPVSEEGWDHYKAALIGVNLKSYIASDEKLESAVLKFSGVQNYMEPEKNDILHIDLLKYNLNPKAQQYITYYNDNQNSSNYFQVANSADYAWLGKASDLGSYTDNNDGYAKIEYAYKIANWENTLEHQQEIKKGKIKGYYWRYESYNNSMGNNGALWSKYSGWTTEAFDRVLDVNLLEQLMASSNGWIGIGLDADCHYTGTVKLVVTTSPTNVPEPGSLSFLLFGLSSLTGAFFVKKRR